MPDWRITKNIPLMICLLILVVLIGGVMLLLLNQATEPDVPTPTLLTPSEAQEMMQSGEPFVLLDVREELEFLELHIPGAILIPLGDLPTRAPLELSDKGTPIIIYCRSGRRSAEAAQRLAELGYEQVYDLGGILDWTYETTGG